jgi:hypothetical protein
VWVCQLAVTYRCAMLYPAATTHTRSAACTGHSMRGTRLHTPGDNWAIECIKHLHQPLVHLDNTIMHSNCVHCSKCPVKPNSNSVKLGQTWVKPTLLLLLKLMGGLPAAKCCTTLLSSCLPVHSCRGFSTAGGGSCRCTAGVLPGLQGVQAANSSWLNSARVKKQSLQACRKSGAGERAASVREHTAEAFGLRG